MEFKVGDKVKIRKDFSKTKSYKITPVLNMEKYKGKIAEIQRISTEGNYNLDIDNMEWYWSDDMLEPYETKESNFNKLDLKNGDIVTKRNGEKRTLVGKYLHNVKRASPLTYYTEDLKDAGGLKEHDIIKVERPVKYETVFERKEEILDGTEKKYLARVIKPFRHKVKSIMKRSEHSSLCYIKICLKNGDAAYLPCFKENSMYKGMEPNREYSLKELGLEWTVAKNNFKGENYEC